MQRGQWAATTEIKVNYLAPLKAETVDAEATVVAMTKRSAVVRCELYRQDDDRRVLAAAQATITIVAPRCARSCLPRVDRQGAGRGKSVSVGVDFGGRRV